MTSSVGLIRIFKQPVEFSISIKALNCFSVIRLLSSDSFFTGGMTLATCLSIALTFVLLRVTLLPRMLSASLRFSVSIVKSMGTSTT